MLRGNTMQHEALCDAIQPTQGQQVSQLTCALPDHEVISSAVPVEAQLRFPGKLSSVHDRVSDKRLNDVTSVDISDDEGIDLLACLSSKVAPHHACQISKLVCELAAQLLHMACRHMCFHFIQA